MATKKKTTKAAGWTYNDDDTMRKKNTVKGHLMVQRLTEDGRWVIASQGKEREFKRRGGRLPIPQQIGQLSRPVTYSVNAGGGRRREQSVRYVACPSVTDPTELVWRHPTVAKRQAVYENTTISQAPRQMQHMFMRAKRVQDKYGLGVDGPSKTVMRALFEYSLFIDVLKGVGRIPVKRGHPALMSQHTNDALHVDTPEFAYMDSARDRGKAARLYASRWARRLKFPKWGEFMSKKEAAEAAGLDQTPWFNAGRKKKKDE